MKIVPLATREEPELSEPAMKNYDVTVTLRLKAESEQDALAFVHKYLVRLEDDTLYIGYSDMSAEEVSE